MIRQNLHTHTVFGDGRNTPEEMVRGALAVGCTSLGFSEHSPLPPAADPDGWSMAADQAEKYRGEILRLQAKYRGELEIFLGLEQDLDSPPPPFSCQYRIGSVHSVMAGGMYFSVDESPEAFDRTVREQFGGDPLSFAAAYYRREAEAASRTGCQIVGHFDLIAKFNEAGCRFDESAPRYRRAALEALEAVMEQDVIFEINTGAMSRGYRTAPYPAPFLLKAIRAKNGRVCLSSDCHSDQTILSAFPQAADLAVACGFREAWILTPSGFQPQPLP